MALRFRRSTEATTRKYERSPGMTPNTGGVSSMTIVNPGRAPTRNPFQWIQGKGQRHQHVSPPYRTMDGARGWKKKHQDGAEKSRLYPVDEYGTIVSRPISKRLTSNRRTGMARYNLGQLRRAMRRNMSEEDRKAIFAAKSAIDTGGSSSKPKRRPSARAKRRTSATVPAGMMSVSVKAPRKRRKTKAGSRRRKSVARSSRRRASRRASVRRASRRRSSKRRASRRRASKRTSRRASRRRSSRRASRRGSLRRRGSGRRVTIRKHGWKRKRTAGGRKRKSHRRGTFTFGGRKIRTSKRTSKLALESLRHGYMPAGHRVGRLFNRQQIQQLSLGQGVASGYRRLTTAAQRRRRSKAAGRISARRRSRRASVRRVARRRSTRRRSSRRRASVRRHSRRRGSHRVGSFKVGRRRSSRRRSSKKLAANRRRRTRRNPRYVIMNGRRRSRRASRRRSSRRGSRRRHSRRRLTRNMLVASGMNVRGGKGTRRRSKGYAVGKLHQLVELGPKSKRRGYPVYVPASVSTRAYLRRFTFGGAAKRAHARRASVTKNSRRHSMRRRTRKNSRRHSRRRRTTRNPRYVIMNRRRRLRRNLFGADLVNDVAVPAAGGTVGFLAVRAVSNLLADQASIRNILDSGAADASTADNTKLAANALGIVATLALAQKVPMIKKYQGSLLTGMGLAFADRVIRKVAPGQSVLSGFGEYVNQPMSGFGAYVQDPSHGIGEYVNQPMSGLGEYVNQPMSGMGNTYYAAAGMGNTYYAAAGYAEGPDPANQEGIDGLMDVAEAAAGVEQAAAGTFYAMAGLGQEADASLEKIYQANQPPFESIQTPVDPARGIVKDMPYDKPVPTSLVTPEGRGFAGGLFARSLFAGMMGS